MLIDRATLKPVLKPVEINLLWINGESHKVTNIQRAPHGYIAVYVRKNGIDNAQCHTLPSDFVLDAPESWTIKTSGKHYRISRY